MKPDVIYLDNAATTRLDPGVLEKMLPYLGERYGNPSSLHGLGLEAHRAVERARERCARLLDTRPDRIVFTAGGSESNNLLIKGRLRSLKGRCALLTRLEHASVAEPMKALARHGVRVLTVENDKEGRIDLGHLEHLLSGNACGLLCVIHGSNEVGTLQDARALGRLLRAKSPDTWFHLDAVQSIGHLPLEAEDWGVHSMALSLHKIHGPPGAGLLALYCRADLAPLVAGGGQEEGRRSGTENVPAIVGTAEALEKAVCGLPEARARMASLRDRLAGEIQRRIRGVRINGAPFEGLPHILSVSFEGLLGEVLLHHLEEKGLMVSTGSACHSKWKDASETLKALRLPERMARATIRFSLSRHTTEEEILRAVELLEKSVAYLREVGVS
jgi:cysteine desulfurase